MQRAVRALHTSMVRAARFPKVRLFFYLISSILLFSCPRTRSEAPSFLDCCFSYTIASPLAYVQTYPDKSAPPLALEWSPPAKPEEVVPLAPLRDKSGKLWEVSVAACLSRYPRITPDKTKEELQYEKFRNMVCCVQLWHSLSRLIWRKVVSRLMKFGKQKKLSEGRRTPMICKRIYYSR